jgi:hypothetical protein
MSIARPPLCKLIVLVLFVYSYPTPQRLHHYAKRMNLKYLRHAKRPAVRASAASTLETSTKLPNSGLTFIDNSQGSCAAIAELSKLLDIALEQFDIEGEPSDQLQLQLQRLNKEAAKYTNSRLDDDSDTTLVENWNWSAAYASQFRFRLLRYKKRPFTDCSSAI